MLALISTAFSWLAWRIRSRAELEFELIALRHQVAVLNHQRPGRLRLCSVDRLVWVWLYRVWPRCLETMVLVKPADIHAFIKEWLTRGNPHLAWENDGYPAMSHFRQIQSFWDFRDHPNVFMSHYEDLKTDFANEARRIAKFLEIDANDELIRIAERLCSFEAMKRDGAELMPMAVAILDGGAQRFFNKGVSGRWKNVFTAEELALYDAAVRRSLTSDCARWLERGRRALAS
jgi:hypothetical protein